MESNPTQPQKLVFHIPSGRDIEVTQAEWNEIQSILTAHKREHSERAEAK